jgi:hypothetical protein
MPLNGVAYRIKLAINQRRGGIERIRPPKVPRPDESRQSIDMRS